MLTAPWRTGKRRRSSRRGPAAAMAQPGKVTPVERPVRPRRSKGAAAATNDRFMDVVVLLSVVLFILLAAGIGLLVLRSTVLGR